VASQTRTLAADVQPIFSLACTGCHSGAFPSGGMDLSSGAAAGSLIGVGSAGCPSLVRVMTCGPLPSQSLLIDKLQAGQNFGFPSSGCGGPMPASGSITAAEFETILDWVAQGAPQ
jgi:cytochrome c551/c552